MGDFKMRIAGRCGYVRSLFDSTRDYCAAYLTEEAPLFEITVTPEDLTWEQAFLDREADEEGLRRRVFSQPFLERAAIQRKFSEALLEWNTLLFHGSAVALEGKAYLFTAACGTGKSTHTRLWRQVFPDAFMINDDKPFLRLTEDRILVCGAPWSGKHGLDTNCAIPLQGICVLERGQTNIITPCPPEAVEAMIRSQCAAPRDPAALPRFEQLTDTLLSRAKFWQMACTKDPAAAAISHRAMSGE